MMNHTSFRPSVLSRSASSDDSCTTRIGLRPASLIAALTLAIGIMASLITVATAQRATATPATPAGLFFKSDLIPDVFAAPTLASDVVIDISGDIARVNIRQRFRNPSKAWLEGIYVFPLPERAAVDRLIMHIGAREIEGQILEKQEAEKVYRDAADAGRHASLLSSARPNVFSTSLANIGPGEEIVIEIEYQDRIRFDDGAYSYRFPMVVNPRYTPGDAPDLVVVPPVPREGKWPGLQQPIGFVPGNHATPKRAAGDLFGPVQNPEDGVINPVSLAVLLDAGVAISDITSPNHAIAVERDGESRAIIALAEGSVPADQDFVLHWAPASGTAPAVGLFVEEVDGSAHLVTTVLPPAHGDADPVQRPRDIVFILDKSGSMHGTAIAQAKQAIRLAISRLPRNARFNLIAFDNTAHPLFNGLRPADENFITRAFEALDQLSAEGGTEMREALNLALDSPRDDGHLMQVVFLTDGSVSNERELFDLIDRRLGEARLFTVGIGPAPNSFFMRRAAETGRGAFTYIDDPRELDDRVSALLRKLERPAVTDLRVTWDVPGETTPQTYPVRIPDLYFGEPVTFATRMPDILRNDLTGTLRITGRRGDQTWTTDVALSGARPAPGAGAVWARTKIADLQAQRGQTTGEQDQIRAQIIETALTYRLVTQFTSLVAIDDAVIARPNEERLAQTEIPRNLPDGMSFEKVFGAKAFGPAGMAPVRQDLAQSAAFRQAIGLPVTATPATQMAISGGAALILALSLFVLLRRRTDQAVS